MKIEVVHSNAAMKRGVRRPRFDVYRTMLPYEVVPFMIHPVLPGETLKKLWWQFRGFSWPLKNRLFGAHFETFYFYVKHTDLDDGPTLVNMHVTNASTAAIQQAGADLPFFHAGGGINFTKKCYDLIMKWYFRDADETLTPVTGLIGNGQPARISQEGWWQSLKLEATNPANDHELPGDNPTMPTEGIPAGYATFYDQWERMRAVNLTTATFEDYLRSNGVNVAAEQDEEMKRPELLRHLRDWQFPANTVEPTTGTPSTAHVITQTGSADKDRLFKEPGFIIGLAVYKPKIRLSNIAGSLAHFMVEADDWLPAILRDQAFTALKEFATATGPAPVAFGQDVWVDLRDLLLYGEQFGNIGAAAAGYNNVALPNAVTNTRYLTQAQAQDVFVDTANGKFEFEGIVSADIASPIYKDLT